MCERLTERARIAVLSGLVSACVLSLLLAAGDAASAHDAAARDAFAARHMTKAGLPPFAFLYGGKQARSAIGGWKVAFEERKEGAKLVRTVVFTLVPVRIKVIGADLQGAGRPVQIEKPTSYLAVSHIIARLLEKPPYTKKTFAPSDYVADLPVTPFVTQNDEVVMVGHKQRYYLRQDASGWLDCTDF